MKNEDYVLPYQILAYANFLSSNWDVAADYFLKLTDFDKINTDRYTFLVGVSYYRQGKYEQSLLYLNQVTDTGMLTDVYRYQLLSSLGIEDTDAAVRIRQKLLGQSDVQDSDFMQFFTSIFYQPYVNAQPFTIYQANPQLVSLYQDACSRLATSKDVCTYGEV
jgi:tetratricopeptide (TPR) repeat protein